MSSGAVPLLPATFAPEEAGGPVRDGSRRACILWLEGLRLEAEAGIRASWTQGHLPLRHSAGISPDFPSVSVASMDLFEVETALSVAAAGWRPVARGNPPRPVNRRRLSRAPGRRPGRWWPAWPA